VVTVVDAKMASQIVWLDAYITNVDRTFRNTNMLMWHKELWLIMEQVSIFTIRGLIGKNTLKVRLNSLKITFYFHKPA
jgi:hypothetical protein